MTKNNKGLGRGIDALFQDYSKIEEVDVTKDHVVELSLTDLRPNPYQPRKTFDEGPLNELAKSIEQSGVFQPIIVRKSKVKGYEIIAGERRFRASKIAKKNTIPAIIKEFDEETMMQVAVLENLQREDLSPLEEAKAYEMLMDNLKLTQAQLAVKLGKSRSYIANYLRLLALPDMIKTLVEKEALSMGQARTLLGMKDKKAMIQLANRAVKEGLTVRQLEQIVNQKNKKENLTKKDTKAKQLTKSPYLKETEEKLQHQLGTSVVIHDKMGKGKIEIQYLSNEDLERILEVLHLSEN